MLKSMELKQEIDELTASINDQIEKRLMVPEDVQDALKAKIAEYKAQKAAEAAAKDNSVEGEDIMDKKVFSKALKSALLGNDAEIKKLLNLAAGNNGAVSADGGYLVPSELLGLAENNEQAVDMRRYCTTIPVSTRAGSVPTIDYGQNVVLTAFDENNSITEKKAAFGSVSFSLASKGAVIPVSRELLMDAKTDVLAVVGKLLNRVYMKDVNTGILTAATSAATAAGTPATVGIKATIDAIKAAINTLPLDAGNNAIIVMPQATWALLANTVDKNDRYLLAQDAFGNTIKQIEGHPIVVVEDGELATRTILVGDFRAMYHIAWPDLEIMSSAEAGFAKNSVYVRAVCRHTSICTYAAAFKKIIPVANS